MTITRRDVAAMRLAYECLRVERQSVWESISDALDALELGEGSLCKSLFYTLSERYDFCIRRGNLARSRTFRILRVRLALLLRAYLREPRPRCASPTGCSLCRPKHVALWEQAGRRER